MKIKGENINIGDLLLIEYIRCKKDYFILGTEKVVGFVSALTSYHDIKSIEIIPKNMVIKLNEINSFRELFSKKAIYNIGLVFYGVFSYTVILVKDIKSIKIMEKRLQ